MPCFQGRSKSEETQALFLYLNPCLYQNILQNSGKAINFHINPLSNTKSLMPNCGLNIVMLLMPEESILEREEQFGIER